MDTAGRRIVTTTKTKYLYGLTITAGEYIEETIRIWIANLDGEMTMGDLRARRKHFFPKVTKELRRRDIPTVKW